MRNWILGAVTFWPPLYIALFIVVVGAAALSGESGDPDEFLLIPFDTLMILHLTTMVVILVLLVIYIVDAYRSTKVPDNRRVFWAVALFLGSVVAMPVYWWLYLRPGT